MMQPDLFWFGTVICFSCAGLTIFRHYADLAALIKNPIRGWTVRMAIVSALLMVEIGLPSYLVANRLFGSEITKQVDKFVPPSTETLQFRHGGNVSINANIYAGGGKDGKKGGDAKIEGGDGCNGESGGNVSIVSGTYSAGNGTKDGPGGDLIIKGGDAMYCKTR